MESKNVVIYDLEIFRSLPPKNDKREDGIEYCDGWHDHDNMGITVLGAYDYNEDRYRVFCEDNAKEFSQLASAGDTLFVGFNNIAFDNGVLYATDGWTQPNDDDCYDLLREIWAAAGHGPEFNYKTHAGYGLDAMCERNFGTSKTGNGALAPIAWQAGKIGEVIDYCLNDVRLTKQLFDKVLSDGLLVSPVDGQSLKVRRP